MALIKQNRFFPIIELCTREEAAIVITFAQNICSVDVL